MLFDMWWMCWLKAVNAKLYLLLKSKLVYLMGTGVVVVFSRKNKMVVRYVYVWVDSRRCRRELDTWCIGYLGASCQKNIMKEIVLQFLDFLYGEKNIPSATNHGHVFGKSAVWYRMCFVYARIETCICNWTSSNKYLWSIWWLLLKTERAWGMLLFGLLSVASPKRNFSFRPSTPQTDTDWTAGTEHMSIFLPLSCLLPSLSLRYWILNCMHLGAGSYYHTMTWDSTVQTNWGSVPPPRTYLWVFQGVWYFPPPLFFTFVYKWTDRPQLKTCFQLMLQGTSP